MEDRSGSICPTLTEVVEVEPAEAVEEASVEATEDLVEETEVMEVVVVVEDTGEVVEEDMAAEVVTSEEEEILTTEMKRRALFRQVIRQTLSTSCKNIN